MLRLGTTTLGIQKDKPNVTYSIGHILGTYYVGNEYPLNLKNRIGLC